MYLEFITQKTDNKIDLYLDRRQVRRYFKVRFAEVAQRMGQLTRIFTIRDISATICPQLHEDGILSCVEMKCMEVSGVNTDK